MRIVQKAFGNLEVHPSVILGSTDHVSLLPHSYCFILASFTDFFLFSFFLVKCLFLRERERESMRRGGARESETEDLKQAVG